MDAPAIKPMAGLGSGPLRVHVPINLQPRNASLPKVCARHLGSHHEFPKRAVNRIAQGHDHIVSRLIIAGLSIVKPQHYPRDMFRQCRRVGCAVDRLRNATSTDTHG